MSREEKRGLICVLLVLITIIVCLIIVGVRFAQAQEVQLEEYYYEPWVSTAGPVTVRDHQPVRISETEIIYAPDSLKQLVETADWSVLVIRFNEEGDPDTITVDVKNIRLWEKTTDSKQTLDLPQEVLVNMLRRVVVIPKGSRE